MNRKLSIRVAVLVALLSGSVTACFGQKTPDWPALEQYVNSSMKDWKVPGASVAIVKDGSVIYMKGFGVRDVRTNQPVTPDTLFDIGSCTKAFTSAAIAMLVDDGKMKWDGKVNEYIPFFHLSDPEADENVTMRDILTHRTGLPGNDLLWSIRPEATREELVRSLALAKPNAGFRTTFQYQNIMYVAAGYAVGLVAHTTWDDFVKARIFQPLGMTESDTSSVEAQKAPDFATPHRLSPDGTIRAIPWRNIENVGPAGSINSSGRDMSKWMIFQLNGGMYEGKRLISEKNVHEMQSPQMVIPLDGEIPTVFFPDSIQLSYGMGWFVQDYHGHQLIIHAGDIDGFATMVVLIPEIHTGYFVVINETSLYRQVLSDHIADQLLQLPEAGWSERFKKMETDLTAGGRGGQPWESKATPGTHPSRDLSAYAGKYHNAIYGDSEIVMQDGKLKLQFYSVNTNLDHYQYDTFVAMFGGKTRLTFCLDQDGNVAEFTVRGIEFKRIETAKAPTP